MGIDVHLYYDDHYRTDKEDEENWRKENYQAPGADLMETGWYIRESYGGNNYGTKILIPESWGRPYVEDEFNGLKVLKDDDPEAIMGALARDSFVTIGMLKDRVDEAADEHVGDYQLSDTNKGIMGRTRETFTEFVDNAERLLNEGYKVWIYNSY